MIGLGAGGKNGSLTVLVFEYVTGGGMVGRDIPESWLAEGTAMRRAIAEDFAAVPAVQVVMTLGARFPVESPPGVIVRTLPDHFGPDFRSLAAEADYTVLIAPETGGVLADLTESVERSGGRSLGSDPGAIGLTGNKELMAKHFADQGIPTPPTWPFVAEFSTTWTMPIIVKPNNGAGSIHTFVIRDPFNSQDEFRDMPGFLAQPFLPGIPRSASYLIDCEGRPTLLAFGRQKIEIDDGGWLHYRGGTLGEPLDLDLTEVERAVVSVPGLRGFVGVDFLDDPEQGVTILEINPRPTTSYIGLTQLFSPGTIAAGWLTAVSLGLAGTSWPDRLRADHKTVEFGADGSIQTEG